MSTTPAGAKTRNLKLFGPLKIPARHQNAGNTTGTGNVKGSPPTIFLGVA